MKLLRSYRSIWCALVGLVGTSGAGVAVREFQGRLLSDEVSGALRAMETAEGYQGLILDVGGIGQLLSSSIEARHERRLVYLQIEPLKRGYQVLERHFQSSQSSTGILSKLGVLAFDVKGERLSVKGIVQASFAAILYTVVLCALFGVALVLGLLLVLRWIEKETEIRIVKEIADLTQRVAHDLRSPVAAIKVAAKDLSGDQSEVGELLRSASERLIAITSDLLDRARDVRTSKREFRYEYTPLNRLSFMIDRLLWEKRVEFRFLEGFELVREGEVEFSNRHGVNVCRADLMRVLSNLINNGVEALSGRGKVALSLEVDRSALWVRIEDNGVGMPEEVVASGKIIGVGAKATGNGIGLSSALDVIRRMSGRLTCKPADRAGTVVSIELPLIESNGERHT